MSLEKYLRDILENTKIKWTTLEEIAILSVGSRHLTTKMIENNPGPYPVYSSSSINDGEVGRIDNFSYYGEFVTWNISGASAGTVFHRNGKFNINERCGIISIRTRFDISYKFLYYWLLTVLNDFIPEDDKSNVNISTIEKVPVPLIPREIQDKIVSLIDPIKENIFQCISKLNNEIILRKKQLKEILQITLSEEYLKTLYKQYFDRYLEITWTTLEEIATLKQGQPWSSMKNKTLPGPYPIYSGTILNNGELDRIDSYMYDGEFLTWTIYQKPGMVFYRNGKFSIIHTCGIVIINPKFNISYKFLYYWLKTIIKDYNQLGEMFNLAFIQNVKETPVPLIPKEFQDKVVHILDTAEDLLKQYISLLNEEVELRKEELQSILKYSFNLSSISNIKNTKNIKYSL